MAIWSFLLETGWLVHIHMKPKGVRHDRCKNGRSQYQVEYPTGDAGELMVARVANTLLHGIAFRVGAWGKAMALAELDRPGLLIVPVAWGANSLFADLHEAWSVRERLAELRAREPAGEKRFGRCFAFTLGGMNQNHLRHMASRMRDLFPDAVFNTRDCTTGVLAGTDRFDVCEAEYALSCIKLLAPFLQMPTARQTGEA